MLELQDITGVTAWLVTRESTGCVRERRRMNVEQINDRFRLRKSAVMREIARSNPDLKVAARDLLVVELQDP